MTKVSTELIVDAYRSTGSVWKAGKLLGICGQSVYERLRSIGHPFSSAKWTDEEYAEMKALIASGCTIGEVANRLGRPYMGVAIKLSRAGIRVQVEREKKLPKGYTPADAAAYVRDLRHTGLSLRRYARQKGISIDSLAHALQRFEPAFWEEWSCRHGYPDSKTCPNCGATFYPLTKKQVACTRRCQSAARTDRQYFGGKRNTTIGLAEGVCQLCGQKPESGLSSHHILGKENDPENEFLIALCRGCHKIVELLATRKFADTESGWENLIQLVTSRRDASEPTLTYAGRLVCVDIERLSEEDWYSMHPDDAPIVVKPQPKRKKRKNGHQPDLLAELGG
jgi:5-methylcytosine-specific restriction endonuclease McrA/transposase-like protein